MRGWGISWCVLTAVWSGAAGGEICATRMSDLESTPRLRAIKDLFDGGAAVGFVNGTAGSYVRVESRDGELFVTLYSSGFLNLFAIHRDGPLRLCDSGQGLIAFALGRREPVELAADGRLIVGQGGPKLTFRSGVMPPTLVRVHGLRPRGVAGDAKP